MKKISLSILSVFFAILSISCSGKSSFKMYIPGQDFATLKTSRVSNIRAFAFSREQKQAVESFVQENGDGALLLQITAKKAGKNPSRYAESLGFLFDEDLSASETILSVPQTRPLVSWDSAEMSGQTFAVIYSFSKDKGIPAGFYLRTEAGCKINTVQLQSAAAGFDYRAEVPLYGFSYNGGFIVKDSKKIDLSGLSSSFGSETSDKSLMPVLRLNFKSVQDDISQKTVPVRLLIGGEKITVRNPKTESPSILIPAASLKAPFSSLEVIEGAEEILAIVITASERELLSCAATIKGCPVLPVKVDPGLILSWPQKNWRCRDYELYQWDRFDNVLLFDFADYSIQDDFLRRLAFFTEKKGFRGQLLSDSELEGKHGYNAHDYSAESLARFYSTVNRKHFQLNRRELLLKEILIANSIIQEDENGDVQPLKGALISVSKECPSYNRSALLAHEGWHGIYFTDEEFRNVTASLYYTMDKGSLDFLIKYFDTYDSLSYDTSDEDLMKNELMAYMLQRAVQECGPYFVNISHWKMMSSNWAEESLYVDKTGGEGFTACATLFDEYVSSRWNLAAGRIGLISR